MKSFLRNLQRRLRIKEGAQGMLEFALVLPLLLMVLFGVIELGRLFLIYTSVATASREAARYASAAGRNPDNKQRYYLDCAGIRGAAQRVGFFAGLEDSDIVITYDHGPGTVWSVSNPTPPCPVGDAVSLGDRVVITVNGQYVPLMGLVNLSTIDFTSTTNRTVVKSVAIHGTPAVASPPFVTITSPGNPSDFLLGDEIDFEGTATDLQDGDLSADLDWYSDLDGLLLENGASFSTSGLSEGTHQITAIVTDLDGNDGSAAITVNIYTDFPPTVNITAPPGGSLYLEGTAVDFSGTATDYEDGDLSAGIQWSSSEDGGLGTGASRPGIVLSVGVHTITAEVTDNDTNPGSDTITIEIRADTPPEVTIDSPFDGEGFEEGEWVTFSGTATDFPDGDISADLDWYSDVDGPLGSGASFGTSGLSSGWHIITAEVTDSHGYSGSDSIELNIVLGDRPVVEITGPTSGSVYNPGDTVTFSGTADDTEDGDLSFDLDWYSDLDDFLDNGATFSTSELSEGEHTITAEVTDSDGLTGSDTITVIINRPPTVTITAPPDAIVFDPGDTITFSGEASDIEDGDISADLTWTSSLDGAIGSGAGFDTATLSAGVHTITAEVADSGGRTASDSITVEMLAPICPVGGQPQFGTGGEKNILFWRIEIDPPPTREVNLEYVRIEWPGDAAANLLAIVMGDDQIFSQDAPGAPAPMVEVTTPQPIWSEAFTYVDMLFIFNKNPDGGKEFDVAVTFEDCSTIQGTVTSP